MDVIHGELSREEATDAVKYAARIAESWKQHIRTDDIQTFKRRRTFDSHFELQNRAWDGAYDTREEHPEDDPDKREADRSPSKILNPEYDTRRALQRQIVRVKNVASAGKNSTSSLVPFIPQLRRKTPAAAKKNDFFSVV